jgi:hypothetical protein
MKFYRDKHNNANYYWNKIIKYKLTAIYQDFFILFFKNGKRHNTKNAAYYFIIEKNFWLNDKRYGFETKFTKKSWRKFAKLQCFL